MRYREIIKEFEEEWERKKEEYRAEIMCMREESWLHVEADLREKRIFEYWKKYKMDNYNFKRLDNNEEEYEH